MPNHPLRAETVARITEAVHLVAGALAAAEAEEFTSFAAGAVAQVPTNTLTDATADAFAGDLLDLWRFFRTASGAEPNVSVTVGDSGVVVRSVMIDQPFIVDTLRAALRARGAAHVGGAHVALRVSRAGDHGRVTADADGHVESVLRFEAKGVDPTSAPAVESDLRERLGVARAMVADFDAMTSAVAALSERVGGSSAGPDAREAADFLTWLLEENFVFVGITGGDLCLGADRLDGYAVWPLAESGAVERCVQIRKGAHDAPVHRAGRIDEIRVADGAHTVVIRGMFTHRALTQPCRNLPILRRTLALVLSETRQRPNSYRYRGLANIFDSLPTEWLFSASHEQIRAVLDRVFDAEQDQVARVHVSQADNGATTFTLIAIPERRYSDEVRTRVVNYLGRLTGASYTDSRLFAGRFETAMLQIYQTGTRTLSPTVTERLQQFVVELTTDFAERIAGAIASHFGDRAAEVLDRYARAFPASYAETAPAESCAVDIEFLERSRQSGRTLARVFEESDHVVLRVYESTDILLTDLMPVLDNFGLVISDQYATRVVGRGGPVQNIDTFRIARVAGVDREALLARGDKLVAGIEAVFQRKMASDAYNRLVLRADLTWVEVDTLRAYIGYARQLGLRHPIARVQEILLNQADCVSAVVAYFHAKFDPDLTGDRAAAIGAAEARVHDALLRIRTTDEDFVLRTLTNLVEATLRTNAYRTDRIGHYLSFKFDHSKIRHIPLPRLMVEIYVHHVEMEGVHLRGGPIARGGLRYSDRADFRTEVLGLVTTQMVKNVVIVPEGSKGGFYCKYTIDDPAERRRKGDELYQWFIRGLLDITDNYVDGQAARPPRVVPHDGFDPYLVVAADKGTAHLSDTANRLSLSYGFWLGDAFASGGSNGYDHKEVGITARGGWVLVKRHFREMGLDADKDVFTCAGVGDCGGDVFGNGVIETRKMKLLAAFNHVHIFLDPNPDLELSFDERMRLFKQVKGWEHYDRALISAGGGVFDRKAKSIALTPEVRAMLGTLAEELPPNEVIRLILKMPVDLLWNGGIGTYVRATNETNADANDPPNDDLRVSASDLRCKIIGEGGNLGLTAAARVEYALAGGRLNTDFVDNSGGVDTSDHEVNLKILLTPMVAQGRLTMDGRNDLLRSLTDEVAQSVLDNNNANGRLISLDVVRSQRDPFPFGRAIDWLCNRGNVSRAFLQLPSDDDLKRRAAARQGLVRPELAIIQAHVKMHVYKMLMQEDASAIPGFDQILTEYFPTAVRAGFAADLPNHMLAKAIGMTVTLTQVATDAGATYFPLFMDLTGASASRVAGAWLAAVDITEGKSVKQALIAAKVRPEAAYSAWTQFTDALTELVASWLAPGSAGWYGEDRARFVAALDAIAATRSTADAAAATALVGEYEGRGIPSDTAARIVLCRDVALASEVAAVATARNESLHDAAVRYQAVGVASRLLPTLRSIAHRRGEGRWDPVALGILRLRYVALLREVAIRTEIGAELGLGVDQAAASLATGRLREAARIVEQIVGENPDVASLLVGEQQVRAAIARA